MHLNALVGFFHWCEKARAGRLGNRVSTARQRREGERSKACKAAAAAMQTETEGGESPFPCSGVSGPVGLELVHGERPLRVVRPDM